jgi:hypothetical protein
MLSIDLDTIVGRAEGFTTAGVRDELMMLNVEQGAYYSLDPIAAEIWGMLEQPARVQDLIVRLQQRYAVEPEQCAADVLAFLGELQQNGMIFVK